MRTRQCAPPTLIPSVHLASKLFCLWGVVAGVYFGAYGQGFRA